MTDENVAELTRVSQHYMKLLTTTRTAADPLVIAMGIYLRDSYTIITDDAGIQAVCHSENLRFIPSKAFIKLEGFASTG